MDNVLPISLKEALLLLKEAREEANSANRNTTVLAGILRALLDKFWPGKAIMIPYSDVDSKDRQLVVDCFDDKLRISTEAITNEQLEPIPPGNSPAS